MHTFNKIIYFRPDSTFSPGPPLTAPEQSPPPSRTTPAQRGDMQDTIAELTERAHQISQEAGTKVSMAMRDVISAAAGLAGFAIESARDLVQFMVRRGQMTAEEGEKLIRQAEEAHAKRPASERARPTASKVAAEKAAVKKAADAAAKAEANAAQRAAKAAAKKPAVAAKKPAAAKKASAKPAAKAAARKPASKKGKR